MHAIPHPNFCYTVRCTVYDKEANDAEADLPVCRPTYFRNIMRPLQVYMFLRKRECSSGVALNLHWFALMYGISEQITWFKSESGYSYLQSWALKRLLWWNGTSLLWIADPLVDFELCTQLKCTQWRLVSQIRAYPSRSPRDVCDHPRVCQYCEMLDNFSAVLSNTHHTSDRIVTPDIQPSCPHTISTNSVNILLLLYYCRTHTISCYIVKWIMKVIWLIKWSC